MPIIRIELLAGRSDAQKAQVAAEITEAMERICRCTPESTQVVFVDVAPSDWAIAGKLLGETQDKPLESGAAEGSMRHPASPTDPRNLPAWTVIRCARGPERKLLVTHITDGGGDPEAIGREKIF